MMKKIIKDREFNPYSIIFKRFKTTYHIKLDEDEKISDEGASKQK